MRVKRCDLSPDGSLLVYFASKYGQPDETYRDTWTAVSRPPWLTALALWPKGDSWNGGGLFSSNTELWVNHPSESVHRLHVGADAAFGPPQFEPHPDHRPPPGLKVSMKIHGLGEDDSVYMSRRERDGWERKQTLERHLKFDRERIPSGFETTRPEIWERPIAGSDYRLRATEELTGFKLLTEYEIVGASSTLTLTDAEWADVDPGAGIVFASAGSVFRVASDAGDLTEARLLVDLTDHQPEPRTPPDWAKQWPWDARSMPSD